MTEVKRHYDNLLEGSASPVSSSDPNKKQSKPGRRPIESEPKSKRTAQNRAAQRAYRERKERKMKDLEDKVQLLEDENLKIYTETDLLRAQIDMLKRELTKARGEGYEINLPTQVGKLTTANTTSTINSKSSSDFSDSRSSNSSVNESSPDTDVSDNLLKSEFPWANGGADLPWADRSSNWRNSKTSESGLFGSYPIAGGANGSIKGDSTVPDLVSGSSSSTSPLNDNILMEANSNKFDEKLDPFCKKLNEACGTKECPIPKSRQEEFVQQLSSKDQQQQQPQQQKAKQGSVSSYGGKFNATSPFDLFDQGFNESFNFNLTPKEDDDPLSFLNDNNFDVGLAFDDNTDRINTMDNLVTEESVYDPLKDEVNTNFNFNDFIKSSLPSESIKDPVEEPEVEVVPAPERTFKCSEIWDRITSHPRYTEIDIDGLCSELKTKAKCSERGVVINATDVNNLLEQSARRR